MEAVYICILAVVCIFLVPVLLFRPLLVAIANRIAGKHTDVAELKAMKTRVTVLEQQLEHMHLRLASVEESSDFSKKLLEDMNRKPQSDDKTKSL